MAVQRILRAAHDPPGKVFECGVPLRGVRALRGLAQKRPREKRRHFGRQRGQRRTSGRRTQAAAARVRTIKKALRRNVGADRSVAGRAGRQDAGEGVLADEEQLENHHREPEPVVFGQPVDGVEITVLQFGG